jgi:hypothetical protein
MMARDEAKEMFEAFDGAKRSNRLLVGEGTFGRQDARVYQAPMVHEIADDHLLHWAAEGGGLVSTVGA